MAESQNLFLGRMRGKVGALVFATNKGRNIVKAAPTVVANPRSGQQQANRSRFTALMALGRSLRPFIAIGFKEYAGSYSWLNKFMSTNSTNNLLVFDEATTTWKPNYSNLVIAEGSLHPTAIGTTGASAGDTEVVIAWNPASSANQSPDDPITIVAFGANGYESYVGQDVRSAGTATIEFVEPLVAAEVVYIVAYFTTADLRIVSNSFVINTTVLV